MKVLNIMADIAIIFLAVIFIISLLSGIWEMARISAAVRNRPEFGGEPDDLQRPQDGPGVEELPDPTTEE